MNMRIGPEVNVQRSHGTMALLDGRPSYGEVGETFIAVAAGQKPRISDNLHPIP